MTRRAFTVALHHLDDGRAVLDVCDRRSGARIEVRGVLDVCDTDPLQRVIDALPGPLVGGELMAGMVARVDAWSYTAAMPVLAALFTEEEGR